MGSGNAIRGRFDGTRNEVVRGSIPEAGSTAYGRIEVSSGRATGRFRTLCGSRIAHGSHTSRMLCLPTHYRPMNTGPPWVGDTGIEPVTPTVSTFSARSWLRWLSVTPLVTGLALVGDVGCDGCLRLWCCTVVARPAPWHGSRLDRPARHRDVDDPLSVARSCGHGTARLCRGESLAFHGAEILQSDRTSVCGRVQSRSGCSTSTHSRKNSRRAATSTSPSVRSTSR